MSDLWTGIVTAVIGLLGALIGAGVTVVLHRQSTSIAKAAEAAKDKRRLKHMKATLRVDLDVIARRAQQVPGIVKVHKGANAEVSQETKDRCKVTAPSYFSDWEAMSLLPDEVLERTVQLTRLINSHNYDIQVTGGAFGDDNWGPRIAQQATAVEKLANEIAAQLQADGNSQNAGAVLINR